MNIPFELDVLSAAFATRLREKLAHPELPADERRRIEGLLAKLDRCPIHVEPPTQPPRG